MIRSTRYIVVVSAIILCLFYLLYVVNESHTLEPALNQSISSKSATINKTETQPPLIHEDVVSDIGNPHLRANATFVVLVRNEDIEGVIKSVRAIEDRFNSRHGYPYVFLNDVPFSDDFKRRISVLIDSTVEFGVIPADHWNQPDWIDEEKASQERHTMTAQGVKYGDSVAYRNMCRFNSGFFFKHELMQKYRWYWRVEPNVQFHCDIHRDPFLFMAENGKTYGFTIAVYEIPSTIHSLWGHVTGGINNSYTGAVPLMLVDFMKEHPEYIVNDNAMDFISGNHGRTYNLCHFWSNFEIADMEFWRGKQYSDFFEYLDRTGGFYYERWGDAPVHSISASLFLPKSKIHWFEDIGYQHDDWSHCPLNSSIWSKGKCSCDQGNSFDYDFSSCMKQWDRIKHAGSQS